MSGMTVTLGTYPDCEKEAKVAEAKKKMPGRAENIRDSIESRERDITESYVRLSDAETGRVAPAVF